MVDGLVGVVGADIVGRGLARNLAETGHAVVLVDLSPELLDGAREQLGRQADARSAARSAPIAFSDDPDALRAARFVFENLPEPWEAKEAVYRRIGAICRPGAILATASSTVSVTFVASRVRRPDRVIGTHFAGPTPLRSAVEIVPGFHTSLGTLRATRELLWAMNRDYAVVADSPGFAANRIIMLAINEAACLVHEGVASPADVDRLLKSCFGHSLGPLELADRLGLDAVLGALEVLDRDLGGDRFRPCPLLRTMVDADLVGRKSGRGFHAYTGAG